MVHEWQVNGFDKITKIYALESFKGQRGHFIVSWRSCKGLCTVSRVLLSSKTDVYSFCSDVLFSYDSWIKLNRKKTTNPLKKISCLLSKIFHSKESYTSLGNLCVLGRIILRIAYGQVRKSSETSAQMPQNVIWCFETF